MIIPFKVCVCVRGKFYYGRFPCDFSKAFIVSCPSPRSLLSPYLPPPPHWLFLFQFPLLIFHISRCTYVLLSQTVLISSILSIFSDATINLVTSQYPFVLCYSSTATTVTLGLNDNFLGTGCVWVEDCLNLSYLWGLAGARGKQDHAGLDSQEQSKGFLIWHLTTWGLW